MPEESRRGGLFPGIGVRVGLSYLPLWVLEIQSWSFGRTASALTAKLSLQPLTCFFRISSFQYKHIMNCVQSWEVELGGSWVFKTCLCNHVTPWLKKKRAGDLVQWHSACAAHTTPLFGSPAPWRNHHTNKKNQTKRLTVLQRVKGRSSVSVNKVFFFTQMIVCKLLFQEVGCIKSYLRDILFVF